MKHLYLIFILFAVLGCQKSQDLGKVEETIYVRHEGADMPVYLRGNMNSNTILLIVHGGPGGNGWEMRPGSYAEVLEANYLVAYWDQRGQGMSQGKYDASVVTVSTMVEDMKAVVLTLKAKYTTDPSIFALGHSWGGTLTSKFMITADYQNLLKGWIEVDGAHDIPKLNRDAVAMFIRVAQEQIALGNNVDNWQATLDWAQAIDTNNITTAQGGEINRKGFEAESWLQADGFIHEADNGGYKSSLTNSPINPLTSYLSGTQTANLLHDEIESLSLTADLKKVTIPALFIWGDYDFVVPPTLGHDAYNTVSSVHKTLVLLPHSGHSPMSNEGQAFNQAVIPFVEAHR